MKKLFNITKAIILRGIVLVLLSTLTVFKIALKTVTFSVRFVALPVVLFGLLVTVVTYFDNGYSSAILSSLGMLVGITALYYLLPLFPQLLGRAQLRMKNYVFSPIIVRSPVKFTL